MLTLLINIGLFYYTKKLYMNSLLTQLKAKKQSTSSNLSEIVENSSTPITPETIKHRLSSIEIFKLFDTIEQLQATLTSQQEMLQEHEALQHQHEIIITEHESTK